MYFSNTSTVTTGQINGWCWDFGDGTTSCNAPNISANHVYDSTGIYVACLTITTTAGCTSTYCDTVVLTNPNNGCQTAFAPIPVNDSTFTFLPTSTGSAPLYTPGTLAMGQIKHQPEL
ncbi:MAG: PKD domain-containing protein [Sphingobacteriales bacterium JAD_PAG50586_3]|nr:MAG: PKD domain-containing protein [Sphingobacteriales bacterium JAD_PAG50586_3]